MALTDFRNHARLAVEAEDGPVVVTGPNGAGKTNLLEAVSLLAPGRGLRGAAPDELPRAGGPGGWSVAARLGGAAAAELGTGARAEAPSRRVARVNGATASLAALGERVSMVWLTPAMDRLLAEGAGARRRFLDRLTLAFDPAHGRHAARYEAAMRERTRLLTGERSADARWLAGLERAMGEHGAALAAARRATLAALAPALAAVAAPFPWASAALVDDTGEAAALEAELGRRRAVDAAAGRATAGPHKAELVVTHGPSGQPAPRCSTGEQKALLIAVVLAHAEAAVARGGRRPVLLLDEITAHLDRARRDALCARLSAAGQVWFTTTEPATLAALGPATTIALGNS